MKKIIFILFAFSIASCDKQLDVNPSASIDSEEAKKSVELLVTGAYSLIGAGSAGAGMEGGLYATDLLLNGDLLASEDYMAWRGTFNQYSEISGKSMSTTNSSVTRMWRKAYKAINLANTILVSLNNVAEGDRDVYRGQALFIRGIMHFELLRFWMEPATGLGVPIMTQPTEDFADIQLPSRATIDDSYTAIIEDLTEAKSLLPEDDGVYANSYTVAAFLARVYLQKGEYGNALAQANEVIESEKYSLPTSVEGAFNTSSSSENVFEIQQTSQNNAGTANDGLTTFYACDPNTPGSTGRGDVQILSKFINLYEASDKRRSLLIYAGSCAKASVTSGKWKDPYTNIPVIRLSEMYLVRAECNQRLGSAVGDTPLNDVNAIRTKAGASEYVAVDLDDILLERELELAFEGQRIHDFKRTSKQVGDINYTDAKFILPIPQTEMNTNVNLRQNTFYNE